MTLSEMVRVIGNAVERQEGYNDHRGMPTRAQRNNNPGNIWDGLGKGKIRRIWEHFPIDTEGFLILPKYEVGRALMDGQVKLKIGRGESLAQMLNEWDSGDAKTTRDLYVAHVAEWTGLPANVRLLDLVSPLPKA